MRQLKIALQGHGRAINAIRLALEPYGHRWVDNAEDADLVIDDGSASAPFCGAVVMGVRLGIGQSDSDGLPTLQLRAYTGSGQLFAALDVATQHLGNGQRLCRQTLNSLGEWVGVLVSGFARDADHFSQTALANSAPEHPLPALEALAYLHRYNRTATPALLEDARVPIIERLQDSLLKFAPRPALNIDGQVYSYRQLHQQSLAIQQALRPLLANSKSRPVVAVCLNKSLALYASILAVLGCTAVYLPLERSHPPERQRRMLEHAGVTLLLDEGCHPLREQFTALDVSDLPPQPSVDSPLMQRRPASDEACMALHTSGTTGQPKGVLLTQFNLAHFCAWLIAHVHLNSRSRVLQFSSLSFDSSLIDLFPALIAGAQLIVPTEDQRRDPQQLLALLRRQHVSHGFLPPALLAILPADSPLGLDHLLTGGEACEPRVIEHLAGQCQVHNLYGPTETTVLATCRTLRAGDSNRNIGTPIANTQIQILDAQMQPVDEEETGELYIIGPGVGPGYINLPRHTERHYVQLTRPDGRVLPAYRSGDLAKWTKDGIELVGRRDLQVKIRGFRVEPAEIERTLQHSQLFRQVAVVIDGASRIRAFVSGPHPQASPALLKQHARQTLPDYMQPVAYTELPSLPCSANGKIDRQALQAVPLEHTATGDRQSPQTPLQAKLIALWSDLLGVPATQLSTDDSFFNLGGHSILLSTLLLRIREQFGRSLALNRFFEVPTIRTLAALLGDDVAIKAPTGEAGRDAHQTLNVQMLPAEKAGDPRKVIVTGANSFVGVHLVQALLANGALEVACLVREKPGHTASARFAEALGKYQVEPLDMSRVKVHAADISKPRLGLADEVYDELTAAYGALVHNAAHVNHVLDYAALAPDNVGAVLECLRLCESRCKKVFNFVSTLSAASSLDAHGQVLEQHAVDSPPLYIRNGYNLSKWVAERLLARAETQGAWVNIYRPGNISFNSRNGVCEPQRNRLMLMLKGSLQLGLVPRLEQNFDLMPVDFLARFIAFHAGHCEGGHNVFNLHNPQPLSWQRYVSAFRGAGHPFEWVSVSEWQHHLQQVDRHNALFDVLGFYLDGAEGDIGDTSRISHENARRGVARMDTCYPAKDAQLLRKGCDYLTATGFLSLPNFDPRHT